MLEDGTVIQRDLDKVEEGQQKQMTSPGTKESLKLPVSLQAGAQLAGSSSAEVFWEPGGQQLGHK